MQRNTTKSVLDLNNSIYVKEINVKKRKLLACVLKDNIFVIGWMYLNDVDYV